MFKGALRLTVTISTGDCTMSDSGILADASSLAACRRGCLSCARCSVISYSAINRDCSWYAHCRISDLRRPPKEARDYVSVRVKPMPAAPAARWADRPMLTAIPAASTEATTAMDATSGQHSSTPRASPQRMHRSRFPFLEGNVIFTLAKLLS